MADQSIRYVVTAVTDAFQAPMRGVATTLQGVRGQFAAVGTTMQQLTQSMSQQMADVGRSITGEVSAMGGHFSALLDSVGATRGGFVALAGAAAALAAARVVASTAEMTESAMDLGRVLGSTTNEAQVWRLALQDVGASQGDLEGAAKGLSRQLKENEDDMQAMGLRTRDAQGQLRPMTELMADAIDILSGYTQGGDQAMAAQALFGRGVDASSKLLLVNAEALASARETAAELGLEVGGNAVAAWKAYDGAMDRASFSLAGMGNTVGTILMPTLTNMVEVFNSAMPAAIVVVRGAVGGLTIAFDGLANGVRVAWEVIYASVASIGASIATLLEAAGLAMTGDFAGANARLKQGSEDVKRYWVEAFDAISASSAAAGERMAAVLGTMTGQGDKGAGTPEGTRGTRGYTAPPKAGGNGGDATALDLMPTFEAMLTEAKSAAAQLDAIHGMSKEQELQFWEELLRQYPLTEAEKVKVSKKAQEARIALLKEEATQAAQIDKSRLATWEANALARVDIDADLARTLQATGDITQQQLLQQEQAFEERRYAIRQAALQQQLQALDPARDPVQVAQLQGQLEQLEMQHQLKLAQIRGQQQRQSASESQQIWTDLGTTLSGLWDKGIAAMMNGTLTWKNAMKAIYAELGSWFVNAVVGDMVKAWLKGLATRLSATISGLMAEKSAQTAASTTTVGIKSTEASAVVGANAAEAASGAAASQAAIPFAGPVLAMAAFGTVMALVLGAKALIPSARGGFDIPAGVNPLTQLHEREMVLPAQQADVIRSLADGGGAGGGRPRELNVAFKGASVGEFVLLHKAEFARGLKAIARDGFLN